MSRMATPSGEQPVLCTRGALRTYCRPTSKNLPRTSPILASSSPLWNRTKEHQESRWKEHIPCSLARPQMLMSGPCWVGTVVLNTPVAVLNK
jgi:hypothetical protein